MIGFSSIIIFLFVSRKSSGFEFYSIGYKVFYVIELLLMIMGKFFY